MNQGRNRGDGAAARGSRQTVRETGVTVRDEGAAAARAGAGAATVRETAATVREGAATVRETAPTVREDGATVREAPDSPASAAPAHEPQVAGWLPRILAKDYRVVEALPARGAEANLYVVAARGDDAKRCVAKVYRPDFGPKQDVLDRVRTAGHSRLVRIESYGKEAGRWWELMEYAGQGSLRMLIEQEGPGFPESMVTEILRQVNEALACLHELSLEHRDLKPANVLVRSRDPLDLTLTDFGISSVMSATVHLTDTARTIRYAPPEAIGSIVSDEATRRNRVVIERTTWDYWSLGMMLVEMLRGKHPYDGLSEAMIAHQLGTQNVDDLTEAIEDPRWRKLCRGLLRRTPSARWDEDAVTRWLADADDPSLDVADEAPAAMQGTGVPPQALISFDGASYSTPANLGAALAMDWTRAASFWKRRFGDVRTWVTDDLGLRELGDALAKIDDSDISLDAQVFSFVYHLAPCAPARFRDEDLSLSAEGLPALARRAVAQEDSRARETLLALHRHGILTLAGSLPEREQLADVSRRWSDAVRDYERLRRELAAHGVKVPQPDDAELAVLLAASLPDSSVVEPLRARAREAATEAALHCEWYAGLGSPENMPAAALVMLPRLRAPAEREGQLSLGRPRRGLVGGAIVGGLFGMLALQGPNLAGFAGALSLAALFYAFSVVRFWYRENTMRGAWASLFRGVAGMYQDLDIPADGQWRWPLIIFAIWALIVYLFISGLAVWMLSTAAIMLIFPSPESPFSASLVLFVASLYVLSCSAFGAFIGLKARLVPAAPFRWLRNAYAARPWLFLAPTALALIPFTFPLLGLVALWLAIRFLRRA